MTEQLEFLEILPEADPHFIKKLFTKSSENKNGNIADRTESD